MLLTRISGFDWDAGNRTKCEKHGVSREDIEELLLGDPAVAPDEAHSTHEDRYIAVGRTAAGRAMFVAFTYRFREGQVFVRPISARYMNRKEAERYGQESSADDER